MVNVCLSHLHENVATDVVFDAVLLIIHNEYRIACEDVLIVVVEVVVFSLYLRKLRWVACRPASNLVLPPAPHKLFIVRMYPAVVAESAKFFFAFDHPYFEMGAAKDIDFHDYEEYSKKAGHLVKYAI